MEIRQFVFDTPVEEVEKFVATLRSFEDSHNYDTKSTSIRREMEDLLKIRKAQDAKAKAERLKRETAERFANAVGGITRLRAEVNTECEVVCRYGDLVYTVKIVSEQLLE